MAGSTFPEYQELTYGTFASYFVAKPVEVQLTGSPRPIDSVYGGVPYFSETRNGLGISVGVGAKTFLKAAGAFEGTSTGRAGGVAGETLERRDDFLELGGGIEYRVSPTLALGFRATRTEYIPDVSGFDRTTSKVSFVLARTRDFVSVAAGPRS